MEKKIRKILIVISVIILILGVISGISVSFGLTSSIPKDNIYVDGANFSGIVQLVGFIGSKIIGILMIFCSIFIDVVIWIIYGIIYLLIKLLKKINNKCETKNDKV